MIGAGRLREIRRCSELQITAGLLVEEGSSAGSLAADALFIAGGAEDVTSRPCRARRRSPDGTVMTKRVPRERQAAAKTRRLEAVFAPLASPLLLPSIFWSLNLLPCMAA